MKTSLLLALLLTASVLTVLVRAQTPGTPDEIAIKKVTDASGVAADKRDINAFASTHQTTDYLCPPHP
jgi:ribosomal protein L12E/L44/L45/RPP1/RPP2